MSERLRALRADLDLWLGDARHDFARDFGWPTRLSLSALRLAYERNALAAAAINKITAKTWREDPQLVFGDGVAEAGFAALADRTRLFARLAQADARAQVQGYAGLLLRVADGLPLDQPLGQAQGFAGLIGIMPLWAEQLSVADFDEEITSTTFGQPCSYSLSGQIGGRSPLQTSVHASRILLISADGTLEAPSSLAAGYNALLTWQKIMGAGGEGFWRNARNSLVFNLDKDTDLSAMASAVGA